MSLIDAIVASGPLPPESALQATKKRFSEVLSSYLAREVAQGLRDQGFSGMKPPREGPGERAFQGGLGPKKVDVSYADEQHGLLLAVSIKTINFAPFGKNLKNRFSDVLSEAITLHMRFPYSVVCALFAFPAAADADVTTGRSISTFRRATKLLGTVAGRDQYTDPGEKFEHIALLLYQPVVGDGEAPWVRITEAGSGNEYAEQQYFRLLRDIYNRRNPHAPVGETDLRLDE
ncbi:MAG: hypothetical protein AB1449_09930 [Chloroflexota bacterium]